VWGRGAGRRADCDVDGGGERVAVRVAGIREIPSDGPWLETFGEQMRPSLPVGGVPTSGAQKRWLGKGCPLPNRAHVRSLKITEVDDEEASPGGKD